MINGTSSSGLHHDMKSGLSDEMVRNTSDCHEDVLDPYELESRRRAQIERSNEWIEKMSPVVKYKEYIRKQKQKKMQRRKFSLACGLNNRIKQEPISHSSSRRRSKKNTGESLTSSKNRNNLQSTSSAPTLERNLSQPETQDSRKTASLSNRRKSAPVDKMDMRDLDDLE